MAAVARPHRVALPVVTGLVAAGSVALALLPGVADRFVYDRALVLGGEVWRLVTGHMVHFSWTHAGWNLALFAAAGAWLEGQDRTRYLWLILLTALAGSLWFLIALPDMARYGGLSGVVSAMVTFLALTELRQPGSARALWAAALLLLAAKIGYELLIGQPLFATQAAIPFQVAPSAHIIGAVAAVVVLMATQGAVRRPCLPRPGNAHRLQAQRGRALTGFGQKSLDL